MIILEAKSNLIILSIEFFFEKNVDFTRFHLKIAPAFKSQRNSVAKLSYEWQIFRITYTLKINYTYAKKNKIKTLRFFLYCVYLF